MSKFWDNFVEACSEKGLAPTTAMKKFGISTGNIHRWRQGIGPSGETLVTLSKNLGCSIDFLMTGEKYNPNDESVARTNTELAMLLNLRVLPPAIQATALTYVKGMADAYKATQEEENKGEESLTS